MTRWSVSSAARSAELNAALDRARAGDGAAFRELYHRFARAVNGALLAHVPPEDVDDLAQEVFLSAWQNLQRLRGGEHFGGWVLAIARNRARRHLARRGPQLVELSAELLDPSMDESVAVQRGESERILAQLRALPDPYREPLTMRLVEGLSGAAIAELTGLTPGSVRVNLTRGMKQLRERLRREEIA